MAEPPKLILRACPAWVLDVFSHEDIGLERPGLGDRDINYRVDDGQAADDSHKWELPLQGSD